MPHASPLISTLVVGLVLAFAFGVLAQRLRLPPLVGYLIAGIAIGPFTPGFVADQGVANQLAEIGVILLMFGVGLHFSLNELLSVRAIAISGALAQGLAAIPLGMAIGWWQGWPLAAGIIFGIALSIASTVVLLRLLQERRLLDHERGRITVGWLVVQDIAMVLVLVLLPVFAEAAGASEGETPLLRTVAITAGKIAGFAIVMFLIGRKLIPAVLHYVAHTGSRELFRLAVLSIALGFAFLAAELFGVSLALGAFFAGMILSESRLSQQAAQESLPLRDAFAVLFFVSVGMLFDPKILFEAPAALFATLFVIIIAKSAAAYFAVRLFGHSSSVALGIAVSLAQIGEFSFILAGKGIALDVLPEAARDLILAGAILSILVNPVLIEGVARAVAWRKVRSEVPAAEAEPEEEEREPLPVTKLKNHVVLVGHGRVGSVVSEALQKSRTPLLVIENDEDAAAELRKQDIEAIAGNAADPEILKAANLGEACCLLVAIPDAFEGGQVVEQARTANANLLIVARAHSDEEVAHLAVHGASDVVMGEFEIAKAMIENVRRLELPEAKEEEAAKGSTHLAEAPSTA